MLEVKQITIEEFEEKIYDKYTDLFPQEEQRDWNKIRESYYDNFEKFYAIYVNNEIIGFFMLEKLDNCPYYLDYFAIFKKYQSKGYGSESVKKLLSDIVKEDGIIGEIEKVDDTDPITVKRWKFYEKLGFNKFDDVCFLFNIVFNIIIYPKDYDFTGKKAAEVLMDYYKINIGEVETKKVCRIIE